MKKSDYIINNEIKLWVDTVACQKLMACSILRKECYRRSEIYIKIQLLLLDFIRRIKRELNQQIAGYENWC